MVTKGKLFNGRDRSQILSKLKKDYFDLIVIGGGVTGAGIAMDASSRGLKVALIEKGDFGSGTSSKSTKLIHGGLRYLKNFEFSLVREVGQERAIVHNIAPHLVRPEKMLLPLIKNGTYGKIITSVGLMVYDVLADVESDDQRVMLSKEETLDLEPLLRKEIIEGGGLYSEYQTDDFRLVIELIKAARDFDACAISYLNVREFIYKGGKVCGVQCEDQFTSEVVKIHSDYVINATGPWVDLVRSKQEKVEGKKLHLTKGVHIVVPNERLRVKHAVYFDVSDGRMIFAIPKNHASYIGTTDTDYDGNPNEARVTMEDVDYLLDAVNYMFPDSKISLGDVISSWAGIRPLIGEEGKSAGEISRKDEIFIASSGLISIAGGKLTGYRKMAKKAVDLVIDNIKIKTGDSKKYKCRTKKIMLPGSGFKNGKAVKVYKSTLKAELKQVNPRYVDYLVELYGTQLADIITLSKQFDDDDPETCLFRAELQFSMENELTMNPIDFYIHRTGRMYFHIDSVRNTKELLLRDMGKYFSWDKKTAETASQNLEESIRIHTNFE